MQDMNNDSYNIFHSSLNLFRNSGRGSNFFASLKENNDLYDSLKKNFKISLTNQNPSFTNPNQIEFIEGKFDHKINDNEEFAFEERIEEKGKSSDENLVKESLSLMMNSQFELTIRFLEENFPIQFANNPILIFSLLKLEIFENLSQFNQEKAFQILEKIINFNEKVGLISKQGIDILQILISFPLVFNSRYYYYNKKNEILQNLSKLLTFEVLLKPNYFLNKNLFFNEHEHDINKTICSLKVVEEDIIFYIALLYKNNKKLNQFDNFMFDENQIVYDNKNSIFNQTIIEEFVRNFINSSLSSKSNFPVRFIPNVIKKERSMFLKKKEKPTSKENSSNNLFTVKREIANPNNERKSYDNEQINNLDGKIKVIKHSTLKGFHFTSTKRENIDKKVIRKYRKYLSKLDSLMYFDNRSEKKLIKFKNNLLFPPFEYKNEIFKSFNTSYLKWLFDDDEISIYYKEFFNINCDSIVDFLINTFKISDQKEINLLKKYLQNMPFIYKNYDKIKNAKSIFNDEDADFKIDDNIDDSESNQMESQSEAKTYSYIINNNNISKNITHRNINIIDNIFPIDFSDEKVYNYARQSIEKTMLNLSLDNFKKNDEH